MIAEIVWNQYTLAVVGVFAVPIVGVLVASWSQIERARSENDLKRSMIERGMSADDIERVLAAGRVKES